MRLAVIQHCDAPPDLASNVARGLTSLQEAADRGAELALFPELFLTGYYLDTEMVRRAAGVPAALERMQGAVDQLGVSAVLGTPIFRGELLFNAVAVLRPGRPSEFYAKTHPFRGEKKWFAPGDRFWTGTIAGSPCGIVVCYELGFPEVARCLALAGARLLLAPAAWGRPRADVWHIATAARALENGCFLAAANQAGTNGTIELLGESRILDPYGNVLAQAGDEDELLVIDLDDTEVDRARGGDRGGHTYFTDRRPGLYGPIGASD
jgi:predicted amidohydrolase